MRCLARICLRLFKGGAHRRGNQVLGGHHLVDRAGRNRFQNAGRGWSGCQPACRFVGDRHAGDAIARHQLFRVLKRDYPEPRWNGSEMTPCLRALHACQPPAPARSMDMFLWMIPKPPSRAMAIAVLDSVTVSIAADSSGMFSLILSVK